ncbi:MAG: hypothetical protein ACYDH4_09970 [Candidatus Cryosericum sp.]
MNPGDLKLSNGIACITIDGDEKRISVIVPEGWKLAVMTTDSGQTLDIVRGGASGAPEEARSFAAITPRRIVPAPTIKFAGDAE